MQQLPLAGFILILFVGSRPLKVASATPRFSFNEHTPFLTLKWGAVMFVVKFEPRIVKLNYKILRCKPILKGFEHLHVIRSLESGGLCHSLLAHTTFHL